MPIRGLSHFLTERGLVKTDHLNVLHNKIVGFDTTYWLKRQVNIKEWNTIAMGGLPISLGSMLDSALHTIHEANIHPIFTFSGLKTPKDHGSLFPTDHDFGISKRIKAWRNLHQGSLEESHNLFETSPGISMDTLVAVMRHFYRRSVAFFCAPYQARAQLAWFAMEGRNHPLPTAGPNASAGPGVTPAGVDYVFADESALCYGAQRVIVEINAEDHSFKWIDYASLLSKLHLRHAQFVDACILAGFDAPTFPPLAEQHPFQFKAVYELILRFGTAEEAFKHHVTHTPGFAAFVNQSRRQRMLVLHAPIFSPKGCTPLFLPDNPNHKLEQFVGPRFPNLIYYFISQGVIASQVLSNLATGYLVELPPLMDSSLYHLVIEGLNSIRAQTLWIVLPYLFKQHFDRPENRVRIVRWYAPENEEDLITKLGHHEARFPSAHWFVRTGPLESQIAALPALPATSPKHTPSLTPSSPPSASPPPSPAHAPSASTSTSAQPETVSSQPLGDSASPFHLASIVRVANTYTLHEAIEAQKPESLSSLTNLDELASLIILQALQLRGFLNDTCRLTRLGRAFVEAPCFHEQLWTVIELLKMQAITNEPLGINADTYSIEVLNAEDDQRDIRLISRLLSLVPMHLSGRWNEGADLDLIAMHSIMHAVHRSLRNLHETLGLILFLHSRARLPPAEYSALPDRLPFLATPSTAMGIVVKDFLRGVAVPAELSGEANPTMATLAQRFPACTNLHEDLAVAFHFWDLMLAMVRNIAQSPNRSLAPGHLVAMFESANDLLQRRRRAAGML